jgi:DNA/RNA-binding domain of Phe-tRNA-synthetase-like protein
MFFKVSEELFQKFPDFCVAVVVAEGINDGQLIPEIEKMLFSSVQEVHSILKDSNLKERKEIAVWRAAFERLGINPNKFPSSIEALLKRIAKKPEFPSINNVVNLVNAIGIKNMVPMGAHDLDKTKGDIQIRFSREGDLFTPFGSSEQEEVPPGEPVYADDLEVRTRIWVWRQGEKAKVTPESSRIFFPIDGFKGFTEENVLSARDELVEYLPRFFDCRTRTYWIDAGSPEANLQIV